MPKSRFCWLMLDPGSGLKSTQELLLQYVFCEVKGRGCCSGFTSGRFLYKNLRPPRAPSLIVTSLYVQLSKRTSERGVYGRHLFGGKFFSQTRSSALTGFLCRGFVYALQSDGHVCDD